MGSHEHFLKLQEKAKADYDEHIKSRNELHKFTYRRLRNLQRVGQSVLGKIYGSGSRHGVHPKDVPEEFRWVLRFSIIVSHFTQKDGQTFVVTQNGLSARDQTNIPIEVIHLSDREFATAIRKAVKAQKEAAKAENFEKLAEHFDEISKNLQLSEEEASVLRALSERLEKSKL